MNKQKFTETGVYSVEQVADLIKAYRNFGSKSIKELSDWLSKYGLKLKS